MRTCRGSRRVIESPSPFWRPSVASVHGWANLHVKPGVFVNGLAEVQESGAERSSRSDSRGGCRRRGTGSGARSKVSRCCRVGVDEE